MIIGIDLRPLQNGHKYRGIGEVAKQVTNRILALAAKDQSVEFVFFEYEDTDPKDLLDVPKKLKYTTVKLGTMPENDTSTSKKDKLQRNLRELYGTPIKEAAQCDVFLQYDYAAGVPRNTRTVLVKHDLIPYLFWDRYFESAWVPFKNKAARSTLRTLFANHKFMQLLRRSLKNAHVIVSVSESTKRDIEKYFGVNPKKSKVALLGVDMKPAKTADVDKKQPLPTKPYLIFVGAGDQRRRVDDLIAAYNNLKAKGQDIQLVLVGENFKAPEKIPTVSVRNAVLQSSYQNDIITMGYIDDETKQKLIRGALAYVFPTKYEGFGIPILESMLLECPVITYKNSSIPEVGGDHALYARDWTGIMEQVEKLLNEPKAAKEKRAKAAKKHAEQFTWDKTATVIYDELKSVGRK
jgi:glycosyltransferase involved in cell wall biosynthesis